MHLSFKKQFVQYTMICYSFLFHSWSYKLEIKWSELGKFVFSLCSCYSFLNMREAVICQANEFCINSVYVLLIYSGYFFMDLPLDRTLPCSHSQTMEDFAWEICGCPLLIRHLRGRDRNSNHWPFKHQQPLKAFSACEYRMMKVKENVPRRSSSHAVQHWHELIDLTCCAPLFLNFVVWLQIGILIF